MRILSAFLLGAMAWAQPPVPIFPSDRKSPKQSAGAELLEVVCPGHVVAGDKPRCEILCPEFTSFAEAKVDWELTAVTRGHFLAPQSDDVALSMLGCESHSDNWGGTILLTRKSGKWTLLWYKPGIDTTQCHKVALRTSREILVCLGVWGAQGSLTTELYVEDFQSPTGNLMAGDGQGFFSIFDNSLACGEDTADESKPGPMIYGFIERVEFRSTRVAVTAARGESEMKPADVAACTAEIKKGNHGWNFLPPPKRYRIDFQFENGAYRVIQNH